MFNLIVFEAGQVLQANLLQVLLPSFEVKYRNALQTPSITEETVFYVKEIFEISVTWEAHIKDVEFEEPFIVGVKEYEFENATELTTFIKILPESLEESEVEEVQKHFMRIRKLHKMYTSSEEPLDSDALEKLQEEYAVKVRRLKNLLFKSTKSEDSLGILDKTAKPIGSYENLMALNSFLRSNYSLELSNDKKLSLLQPPILAQDLAYHHEESLPEKPAEEFFLEEEPSEPVSEDAA